MRFCQSPINMATQTAVERVLHKIRQQSIPKGIRLDEFFRVRACNCQLNPLKSKEYDWMNSSLF